MQKDGLVQVGPLVSNRFWLSVRDLLRAAREEGWLLDSGPTSSQFLPPVHPDQLEIGSGVEKTRKACG